MPIVASAPACLLPVIRLCRWRVAELADRSWHLVGWNLSECIGKTSSTVMAVDAALAQCLTSTGRVYQLVGPPGIDADAEYTWRAFCRHYGIESFRDATGALWAAICSSYTAGGDTVSGGVLALCDEHGQRSPFTGEEKHP